MNFMDCPNCGSNIIIKHGKRKLVSGTRQMYLCKTCMSTFSNNPLKHTAIDPDMILRGVTFINLGYSLSVASRMLEHVYDRKIPRNTIHYWTKNYKDFYPGLKLKKIGPVRILQHDYGERIFRVHQYKRQLLLRDEPGLDGYISRAIRGIPKGYLVGSSIDDMFRPDEELLLSMLDRRKFLDRTENRVRSIMRDKDTRESLRSILINDDRSVCKNLPVFGSVRGSGRFHDWINLVQVVKGTLTLMCINDSSISELKMIKKLWSMARNLEIRTGIGPERIRLGAFDEEQTWITPMRKKIKKY